jgi:hypothetical protein
MADNKWSFRRGSYAEAARIEQEKAKAAQDAPEREEPPPVSAKMAVSANTADAAKMAVSANAADTASGSIWLLPMADTAKMAGTTPPPFVRAKPGVLIVPNTIVDELLPQLDPSEAVVYLRLYRLTAGWNRPTCMVGAAGLARATKLGERTVMRIVASLEAKGLIERIAAKHTGANSERGNVYRVNAPVEVPADLADTAITADAAKSAVSAGAAHMKERKKNKGESAPLAALPPPAPEFSVYDVRRIAARFRELHHGESDYTKDKLRADVRTALIGEGREPDDRLIDEAIGV